ncbi:hypothetical protein BH11VER1_BH11VER1_16340 [soil metagenome]
MIKQALLVTVLASALLLLGVAPLHAQTATASATGSASQQRGAIIESYRRQDWTGRGSFHRIGMLESQEQSIGLASDANLLNQGTEATTEVIAETAISKMLTLQVNTKSMFFGSDNIFNTENFAQSDGQYAQFVGVALDAQFNENWKLSTTFDQAWFYHFKDEHAAADFRTSTVRQALSYDRFILNNKASISIPLNWQYSDLYNRQTGNRILSTWQFGTGVDFAWFAKSWIIPTFGYAYSYQDATGPINPADKHKHDFNLGMTFIPIKDKRFFIIPSVQYSRENFSDSRQDNAWTPTLTASVQPLKWLAVDLVSSYTDSSSNALGSSFNAFTNTAFIRLFWNW